MRWRKFLVVVGLILSGVSAAHAQKEYEITPFFGARVGGIIDESSVGDPNVDYLKIKNSENYGFMAGVTFWEHVEAEFMWNRQPTSLSSHNPNDNTYKFLSNMNLDMYQVDFLYQFNASDAKFRPFIVGGLGMSHFGVPPVQGQSVLGFSNRFAFNLGGGVKYFFNPHWGIRLEARWSPTNTTYGQGTYCDYYGNCFPSQITNKAEQGQANIGLIFRFK